MVEQFAEDEVIMCWMIGSEKRSSIPHLTPTLKNNGPSAS